MAWPGPPSCEVSRDLASRAHSTPPTSLDFSEDLPIVIECVDTADRIEAVLPALDDMIGDGLVTMERVDVRVYRANGA